MRTRQVLLGVIWLILAAPAAGGEAEKEYFAIFLDGKKVGHVEQAVRTADDKVTTTQKQVMTVSRMEIPLTIRVEQTCVETTDGKPLSFKSVQDLGVMTQTVEGSVDKQGKLRLKVDSAGNVTEQTMDWPEGALLEHGFHLLLVKKGLKEGTKYTVRQFETTLMSPVEVSVDVGSTANVDLLGRVVPLTEIKSEMKGPTGAVPMTVYVDRKCQEQKIVTNLMGMKAEIVACSKQFALSPNDVADFLNRFFVTSPVPLEDPGKAKAITYTLTPTADAKLSIPATDSQSVRQAEGKFIVTVRPAAAPKGARFPYKGDDKTALEALKPTRFLQSDDKKVVELARRAVGDATDAAVAVRRIEAFVHDYIQQKDFSIGYASAAEVAVSRQGDCSEHAVLAAAMCRAVGIPAQVVVGMVYVEQLGEKADVFAPHAWVQARVGPKWVGLDATGLHFGPGHIALLAGNGDLDEFFGIITTLGCFKITGVQVER
ncbi:MAG: hypothetical protein AMJ81_13345 [Phycisphaerae bacterium SM23_33]|nr:MAG: hypothetical protein AMJ81_13345 [Phycisphaerae bacterium SM23_33]